MITATEAREASKEGAKSKLMIVEQCIKSAVSSGEDKVHMNSEYFTNNVIEVLRINGFTISPENGGKIYISW